VIFFPPAFLDEAAELEHWGRTDLARFHVLLARLSGLGGRSLRARRGLGGTRFLSVTVGESFAAHTVAVDASEKATLEALHRLVLLLQASRSTTLLNER
jgi:hypothetical protein